MNRIIFTVITSFILPNDYDNGFHVEEKIDYFHCFNDVIKFLSSIDYPPHRISIHSNFH